MKLKIVAFFVFPLLIACRSTGPINATRDLKVKPSDAINRDNKRVIRKGIREARREMRRRKKLQRKTGYYSFFKVPYSGLKTYTQPPTRKPNPRA